MYITPFYAAILVFLFIFLSLRTLRLRHELQIPLGDAGNPQMLRAMRVHSNFAEYVPLTLLLMLMFESVSALPGPAHVFGLCLLAGRLSHAYGVGRTSEDYRFRIFGMAMTFTALAGSAMGLLAVYSLRLPA
ncbi:MAG TPA: MAPEG family protein [Gammaproteobacteria bacterium]|nr:MAPEG family protein [Gammaproteobacteria bacterium]